jgi:hypothetical protein
MSKIQCSTVRGYIQGVSGLFISKDNPSGLTPKEIDILTAIVFVLAEERSHVIIASTKEKVATLTNHPVQVITNYIKKLRDKRVLSQNNELHKLLREKVVFIEYEKPKEN